MIGFAQSYRQYTRNRVLRRRNIYASKSEIAPLRHHWIDRLVLAACICVAMPAGAATDDVIQPFASFTYAYDDNLLRLHDRAAAVALLGTDQLSDVLRRAQAGLLIEKKISKQLLTARMSGSRTTFSRFSELDHNGRDLLARWNWSIGEYVEGQIGASDVKSLTPFVDYHRLERNLRAQQRQFFDASWRLHPDWRLRGGLARYRLRYDLASQRASDRTEDTAELSLDYLTGSSSSVGVQLRHLRGELPNREEIGAVSVDNSYDQNEAMGRIDWRVTDKTRIQLVGGQVQRRYKSFPQRDFDGLNGRMIFTWSQSAKVGWTVNAWRETGSYLDLSTTHSTNRGVSVGPTWQATAKLRLDGLMRHERRDFKGAITAASGRKDTFRHASVTLSYKPTSRLQIATSLFRDQKDSSVYLNGYLAKGAAIAVSYDY